MSRSLIKKVRDSKKEVRKRMPYDETKLKMKQIPLEGTKQKIVIAEIKEETASAIFGDAARDPKKAMIALYGVLNGKSRRVGTFSAPWNPEEVSSKSNLAKFRKRYGAFPKIGMEVEVAANEAGYWNITL